MNRAEMRRKAREQEKCRLPLNFKMQLGPSRGIAFPTKNPVKEYTKAQKEFLYDYYMERDCKKEANAIWKESDKR